MYLEYVLFLHKERIGKALREPARSFEPKVKVVPKIHRNAGAAIRIARLLHKVQPQRW